jgi:thymidylate synthase ThyX
LLPTATLTNLGWTVNARALAAAIRKLGGSALPELRAIAAELNSAGVAKVPTLLKYCDPDLARTEAEHDIADSLQSRVKSPTRTLTAAPPTVRILRHDNDALLQLTCAIAYPNQSADWDSLEATIRTWSADDMLSLLRRSMAAVGPFDPLARAFEHLNYLVEITVDYGAWRDIQRHRIASQTAQELTPELGFTVPVLIDDMKLRPQFERLLETSATTFDALRAECPHEAVYALMLAFRKRSLFGWNLREIFHFVRLRGTAKGHAAYRVVAEELWRQMLTLHPWLGELVYPLGPDFRA